jgi:alginate O-acetyltransferase complex protein AlgI
MSVGGLTYLLFTLLVWLLVQAAPTARARQTLLLAASYLFYASWGIDFLAVLLASTVVNFGLGALLRRRPTVAVLWTGVTVNLLLLASFKVLPSASASVLPAVVRHLVMPVGISFWTFQALSFLFDTYRDADVRPTPLEFALYLSFWPTVLSGPIARFPDLQPQFRDLGRPTWDDVAEGVSRVILGLFLKGVLAQLLASGIRSGEGIDAGFAQIAEGWGTLDAWALAVGYGFQLFFDFAGYSHVVIGVARLFGIRLPENFHAPYLSPTPAVFWTRWHMSLSFWIRDYVFLPLASRHRALAWHYAAAVIAMSVFGLWHGFTAAFLLWGVFQGVCLVVHRLLQRLGARTGGRVPGVVGWALTFAAVSISWLLFRASDLHQALGMILAALSPSSLSRHVLPMNLFAIVGLVAGGYFVVAGAGAWLERHPLPSTPRRIARWAAPLYYSTLLLAVIVWSKQQSVFVYFQF